MKIATSRTREQFPLSYRKIWKKTLSRSLFWLILLLIALVFGSVIIFNSANKGTGISILILAILAAVLLIVVPIYLYQRWYFAVYYYDLNNDYIIIRKGPITPSEITIPYERIQDVYVDRDLFDRFFGLYDVHLSSATYSSGMAAHIDGVEKPAADGLRAVLLQTVHDRISKHRGQDVLASAPPAPVMPPPAPMPPPPSV